MIEKMKKITFLVSDAEKEDFILHLRKAGIVHIRQKQAPFAETTFLDDKQTKIENLINALIPFIKDKNLPKGCVKTEKEMGEFEKAVQDAWDRRSESEKEKDEISRKLAWFNVWGEFDPDDFKKINEKDSTLKLYQLNKTEYNRIKEKRELTVIAKKNGYFYAAVLTGKDESKLNLKESIPPEGSPGTLKSRRKELEDIIVETGMILEKSSEDINCLKACIEKIKKEKEFFMAKRNMRKEGKFSCLEGFCPEKKIKKVISLSEKREAGYLIETPDNPDEVPTLITNPKWIKIIEPVFNFMNTLPGYKEFDISPYFLIFFSVFFAMLIGDAGYGFLFLITTFIAARKLKNIPREPFFLLYVLSIVTIIWGSITGTWFGIERAAHLPVFNALVIEKINSFNSGNQDFIIHICFVIGAVHLTVAHTLKIIRLINSPKALAEAGWIMILWGMFFVAGRFVLNNPFPVAGLWMLLFGITLVMFCTNSERGVLKGALLTLAELPLSVISSFSDIVSYLRLFAVGYASVIVAASFNNMALQSGMNSVISTMGSVLILFFGHLLNIILGCMAVVVHGIRLNMLEFSGHLGMQWSGIKYEPFKE